MKGLPWSHVRSPMSSYCLFTTKRRSRGFRRSFHSCFCCSTGCGRLPWNWTRPKQMNAMKKTRVLDGWKKERATDIPRQLNGYDCGVFVCMYAECYFRRAKFSFVRKTWDIFVLWLLGRSSQVFSPCQVPGMPRMLIPCHRFLPFQTRVLTGAPW